MCSVGLIISGYFRREIRYGLRKTAQCFQGRLRIAWRCSSHRGDIVLLRHHRKEPPMPVDIMSFHRPQKTLGDRLHIVHRRLPVGITVAARVCASYVHGEPPFPDAALPDNHLCVGFRGSFQRIGLTIAATSVRTQI